MSLCFEHLQASIKIFWSKANWMAWLLIVSNYANWLVTAIKALFNVNGVEFNGQAANDVIYVILVLTVVIPAIVGCGLWVWGLMAGR